MNNFVFSSVPFTLLLIIERNIYPMSLTNIFGCVVLNIGLENIRSWTIIVGLKFKADTSFLIYFAIPQILLPL